MSIPLPDGGNPLTQIGVSPQLVGLLTTHVDALREWLKAYRRSIVRFTHPDTSPISHQEAAAINAAFSRIDSASDEQLAQWAAQFDESSASGSVSARLRIMALERDRAALKSELARRRGEVEEMQARCSRQLAALVGIASGPREPLQPDQVHVAGLHGQVISGSFSYKRCKPSPDTAGGFLGKIDLLMIQRSGEVGACTVSHLFTIDATKPVAEVLVRRMAARLVQDASTHGFSGEWQTYGFAVAGAADPAAWSRRVATSAGALAPRSPDAVAADLAAYGSAEVWIDHPPHLLCVEWLGHGQCRLVEPPWPNTSPAWLSATARAPEAPRCTRMSSSRFKGHPRCDARTGCWGTAQPRRR